MQLVEFVFRRWKGLLLAAVCLLVLLIGLVLLPFALAEPWQRVAEEARAEGLPTSHAETGRTGDPAREAAARTLIVLQRALSLYRSPHYELRSAVPTAEPPPEMASAWAGYAPGDVAAALAAADVLFETPWERRPVPTSREWGESRMASSFVRELLSQRWLVAMPADGNAEALRLVRTFRLVDGFLPSDLSLPLLALLAHAERISDPAVPALLRSTADAFREEELRLQTVMFSWCVEGLRDLPRTAREIGLVLPGALELPPAARACVRLGGAGFLREVMAWQHTLRQEPDPVAVLAQLQATRERLQARPWNAKWLAVRGLAVTMNFAFQPPAWPNHAMRARLVAWRLDGREWPIDLWDPAKRPLRRIERDGVLVGAYSVGINGRDDGGARYGGDILFPLVADPPPKPAPAP